MAEVTIFHEEDRLKAIEAIRRAPIGRHGLVFSLRDGKRTDAQNRTMWKMLQPFADQVELGNRTWDRASWKCILMEAAGHKPLTLPNIQDNGIFSAGFRSSKLGVKQMTELIELIIAEGAQRGIDYPWLHELP